MTRSLVAAGLTFGVEPWSQIQPCMAHLMRAHWAENGQHKDEVPLDPDWALYERLEVQGVLSCICARDENGLVVGYYISHVLPHPHYKSTLYSFIDLYYLLPECRTAANGIRLFQEYERAMQEQIRDRGCECMVLIGRARLMHNPGPLLERLGWEPAEMCYTKVLHG